VIVVAVVVVAVLIPQHRNVERGSSRSEVVVVIVEYDGNVEVIEDILHHHDGKGLTKHSRVGIVVDTNRNIWGRILSDFVVVDDGTTFSNLIVDHVDWIWTMV
jgi:hypothetical protein